FCGVSATRSWPCASRLRAAGRLNSAACLFRRHCRERESMHTAPDLLRDSVINAPLTLHARQSGELRRHNPYTEMRFAAGWCTGMTGVAGTLVEDDKLRGTQCRFELASQPRGNGS